MRYLAAMSGNTATRRLRPILALLCLVLAAQGAGAAPDSVVTLFAAASTSNAIAEIADSYEKQGDGHIHTVFASSGVLAR